MHIFGTENVAMFDWPWSVIHFTSGTVIGLLGGWLFQAKPLVRFWIFGSGLLLLWEVYERAMHYLDLYHHQLVIGFKAGVMGFAFAPETWVNTTGDLVIGGVGMLLGRWMMLNILRRRRA